METNQKLKKTRFSKTFIVIVIVVSLIAGGLLGYSISNVTIPGSMNDLQNQVSTLQGQVSALQGQVSALQSTQNGVTLSNSYITGENASLAQLYAQVKDSVIVIRGLTVQYDIFRRAYYTEVQGSGFIYNFTGKMVAITNYHVVQDAINITVTFLNGDGYVATVLGSDPYADLAVLSTNAPQYEYKPLLIISSSTLNVGDPVIAVGNPLGLTGSVTSGIVSALGRSADVGLGYPIADCVQTTAPINPGNSGGPLLNYQGEVVGITSYAVTSEGTAAQGLGLAIPSSTILREIESLVTKGSYNQHPTIDATGIDMTYEIANAMNVNVTYGWLIVQVTSGGPAAIANLRGGTQQVTVAGQSVTIGGDIIVAINGARITGIDDLSTFLEEHTSPGQTIDVTIIRNGQAMTLSLKLGTRPPPT